MLKDPRLVTATPPLLFVTRDWRWVAAAAATAAIFVLVLGPGIRL